MRWLSSIGFVCVGALLVASCGGTATAPTTPAIVVASPPITPPVIDGITVQGTRLLEPANFADLGESLNVSAKVHDAETAAGQLLYTWTATAGTFTGSGANVTWTAPSTAAPLPADVTITLLVTERYGASLQFQQDVTGSATLSLHDSVSEVGDMARLFLLEFSNSSLTNASDILRNFSPVYCPDPREITSEQSDINDNRANRRITDSRIGPAKVIVNFRGRCPYPDPTRQKAGDACAIVPSYWADVDLKTNVASAVDGTDYLAAVYAPPSKRWWLCSSDYDGHAVSGVPWRGFIRR